MKYAEEQVQESLEKLRKLCPPGTTVYTSMVHVSRSGMSRDIRLFVIDGKGEDHGPTSIGWYVAHVLGSSLTQNHAVKVSGWGMDMGFHLVNALSYALHGYKSKGADARASEGRPFKPRRGHFRAGYSLNHRWL